MHVTNINPNKQYEKTFDGFILELKERLFGFARGDYRLVVELANGEFEHYSVTSEYWHSPEIAEKQIRSASRKRVLNAQYTRMRVMEMFRSFCQNENNVRVALVYNSYERGKFVAALKK